MKKIFPTDKKTNFLVADDVRQEVSGKAIIIGYYAGAGIVFSYSDDIKISEKQPFALPSLCFLWVFTDGEGNFNATVSIKNPDGDVSQILSETVTKNYDGAANLLIKIAPFVIHVFGEFECCVDLGEGHQYKRKFRIINNPT